MRAALQFFKNREQTYAIELSPDGRDIYIYILVNALLRPYLDGSYDYIITYGIATYSNKVNANSYEAYVYGNLVKPNVSSKIWQ